MGDPSSSSASQNPHSVFSDLVRYLKDIPQPNCVHSNLSISSNTSTDGTDSDVPVACLHCEGCRSANRLSDIRKHVSYIESTLGKMSIFEHNLGKHLKAISMLNQGGTGTDGRDLVDEPRFEELVRAVEHFKFQLPYTSLYELPRNEQEDVSPPPQNTEGALSPSAMTIRYDRLSAVAQKCLLYCSVLDGDFKKRVLINWWIGEGLIVDDPSGATSLETQGERILKILEGEKFMVPLKRNRPAPNTWQMEPSVRCFLSSKFRKDHSEAVLLRSDAQIGMAEDTNRAKTVFNVNRSTIGSTEAKIIAYMETVQVLHLGRSQPNQHVEVKSLKWILQALRKMKQLRLLSLWGISSIRQPLFMPTSLMVLDLRGCQALELLPSSIRSLKNLRHLDLSNCHILRQIPKELRLLSNLEVLKGFVVGLLRSCSLEDLGMLKKLHKLSICVSRDDFPQHCDLVNLANIQGLVKLKILWKPASKQKQDNVDPESADPGEQEQEQDQELGEATGNQAVSKPVNPRTHTLFTCCFRNQMEVNANMIVLERLEKLDLWCAPARAGQVLLSPHKFPSLKQLYIRGADFHHLPDNQWLKLETLRLLFLTHFHMKWEELGPLFPSLSYLEMQKCPKLDEFSQHCDHGVWIKMH